MNESPWQPPTEHGPDHEPVAPESMLPPAVPAAPGTPATPSPWSPEGAGAWGEPTLPEPTVPGPTSSEPFSAPPAPGTVPVAGPVPSPATRPATATDVPAGDPSPPAPRRPRSKLAVAGGVAAVLALGLAGLFAVQRFSGEDAGGSATAEELGRDLMAAIEAEDVLGVIDTMLPGERESLGDPFVDMVGELRRLEVLADDTDLSRLLGLDVELTDEVVQIRGTNVPDVVTVKMEADAAVTLDGSTLPLGAFVEEQLPDDALTELRGTQVTERDELDLEMTAVLHDGRWYFSVFHTVAELAREASGIGPIPDEGVAPEGGDSPEAAVDRLLDSVEALDLRGLISILDPAEAAALQRYAPLFLDDAEAALAELPLDWRIGVREFRVEGDGGERTVFVDAIGVTGEADGKPFGFGLEDGCVRAEFEGESYEECGGEPTDDELASLFAEAPAAEAFTRSLEEAFADLEPVGLELRQRDGAWYVSPLATGTDAMLAAMRALDRAELDVLVSDGQAAVEELVELAFGGFGALEDELVFGDEPVFGDAGDEAVGTDDSATTVWDECYEQVTAADAAACFDRYVSTGEIDRAAVPTSLMYPECGLAELTWEGGLYRATDEEFAAALDASVPCFRSLVDGGEIDEWMLPFEVRYADCFEGRNWYTEFEDDAYNERVDACISGE